MNVIQSRMLSVFDFDGTLTRHDSFIPFLRFAFGNRAFPVVSSQWLFPRYAVWGRR